MTGNILCAVLCVLTGYVALGSILINMGESKCRYEGYKKDEVETNA